MVALPEMAGKGHPEKEARGSMTSWRERTGGSASVGYDYGGG